MLEFFQYVYGLFGFEFKYDLSTRPEFALGEKELWDKAEGALADALNKSGKPWKENPGDGAFYGPKIDIKVSDALKREHQLGTIQLDFNLPIRFNLQYRSAETEEHEDKEKEPAQEGEKQPSKKKEPKVKEPKVKGEKGKGKGAKEGAKEEGQAQVQEEPKPEEGKAQEQPKVEEKPKAEESKAQEVADAKATEAGHVKTGFQRPVMIHRAVLGSVERMFAILCEHTGGKWPFWLSPRQIKVIPISEKFIGYAESVTQRLIIEGYSAELDRTNFTINKKVRNAQIAQFNYIAVAGEEEVKSGAVDLRERDNKDRLGKYTIEDLLKLFKSKEAPPSQAELNMKAKAYFSQEGQAANTDDELNKLNEELALKVFLDGVKEPGQRDREVFEKLKATEINSSQHPNLFRWKKFVESHV